MTNIRCGVRAGERGAAIFVVMLVITTLTGLGLFAVRSASLAGLASGYHRQLVQTHFVADYAVLSLAADLGIDPNKHAQNMELGKNCLGFGKQLKPTCAQYSLDDLQKSLEKHDKTNKVLEATAAAVPGSLGATDVEGDMKIELTDRHPAWPPLEGNQINGVGGGAMLSYVMVTISAEGLVRPKQAVVNKWDTSAATAAAIELSRAHLIIGPVPTK
ncbi:MAG: hypothetical protein EXR75_03795 [Myxococcales bacterium]|nr:hypothetical protein [Myxococcales bacterium]